MIRLTEGFSNAEVYATLEKRLQKAIDNINLDHSKWHSM